MQAIFLKILSVGINASWMILAVFFLRAALRRAPKRMACFLWILVGLRLLCPYSIESAASLVPVRFETVDDGAGTGAYVRIDRNPAVNRNMEAVLLSDAPGGFGESVADEGAGASLGAADEPVAIVSGTVRWLARIWVGGMILMLFFFSKAGFPYGRRQRRPLILGKTFGRANLRFHLMFSECSPRRFTFRTGSAMSSFLMFWRMRGRT